MKMLKTLRQGVNNEILLWSDFMIIKYLSTVIIWAVIIYCSCELFKLKLLNNGWTDPPNEYDINPWLALFIIAAIPGIRAYFFLCTLFMAIFTQEQIDQYRKK